jgi:2-polyprenyl-3-methyl-5-hydroxy-6-metoxy-1,4-benzoquinol methylase
VATGRYYVDLAAAWVRGTRPDLAGATDAATLDAAVAAGLRVHRFKQTETLPRVRRVLGILKSFAPHTVLDVGSGRGAFLWPLLDTMPHVSVTAVDLLAHRVADIEAVRRGGVDRVRAILADVIALTFPDRSFDVVTILEVLEHVSDPAKTASAVVRMADRAVVATVPSKKDDNPEHVRLFDRRSLLALFSSAGARRVQVDGVLDHFVVVAHR